jgi:hypothetical protein
MAPEQAAGDDVDARADVYSWGVIAYELLAGHHPFHDKTTAQQLMIAHLGERPKELTDQLRDDRRRDPVARGLAALAMRSLEKDVNARPANGAAVLAALHAIGVSAPATRTPRLVIAAGAAAMLLAAAIGGVLWWSQGNARAAALVPRIQALAAQGKYSAAYLLAKQARRHLAEDSIFKSVFADVTNEISVTSEPPGARVYIAMFGDSTVADSSDGTLIGTTPVRQYITARGDYRVVVKAPGYDPARRIASRFPLTERRLEPGRPVHRAGRSADAHRFGSRRNGCDPGRTVSDRGSRHWPGPGRRPRTVRARPVRGVQRPIRRVRASGWLPERRAVVGQRRERRADALRRQNRASSTA